MTASRRGIETRYHGHVFRSRLEARWAALFDLLGWHWIYEPLDLDGWIPDFLLRFKSPALVEIKPETSADGFRRHTARIDASALSSGSPNEILLLGLAPILAPVPLGYCDAALFGLLGERARPRPGAPLFWTDALAITCRHCARPSIISDSGSWRCRTCGFLDPRRGPRHLADAPDLAALWGRAHELTRWQPPGAASSPASTERAP